MSSSQLLSIAALQKNLLTSSSTESTEWSELALAIHRGRDHGIPSYTKALSLCENRFDDSSNVTFESLSFIAEEHITSLREIYQ